MSTEDQTSTLPLLFRLPPELIDNLLDHIPPRLQQRTALSLIQVFPDYPISSRNLWRHMIVHRAQQLMPMWRKLREEGKKVDGGLTKEIRTFSQQCWQGDADILNNVMRCLPDVRVLMLNIGTNIAPEHLEGMFEEPHLGITRMEMRFRPYVEQASYYQFLKGSYFDTAVESLYRHWPEIPPFTHFSIVQDLPPRSAVNSTAANNTTASLSSSLADLSLDPSTSDRDRGSDRSTPPSSVSSETVKPRGYSGHGPFPYISENMKYSKPKHFAQPIVFFDIKCLARFGLSPVAANLTHLRFRVPSRDLAYVLIGPQGAYGRTSNLFPALRYLDISTTNVRLDSVLSTLLRCYARLEHLVLDRVNLFGFTAREKGSELCKDLAGVCVSAGLARGKERERQIAAWELADRTRLAQAEAARLRSRARHQTGDESGDERGDGGSGEDLEAIAAVRQAEAAEAEHQRQIEISRSRRGHRSAGHSTFSLRDRPIRSRAAVTTSSGPSIAVPPPDKLYLVLPPLPTLKSVSMGGEAHSLSSANVSEWENEFHAGWRDGLAKVQGWAIHVTDRRARAKRKADDWRAQETKQAQATSKVNVKGKSRTSTQVTGIKPPTDIRLFRFPLPDEPVERDDPSDPTVGLIEIHPEGRDYLEPYKLAIANADMHANNHALPPPCVLCTIPDCEGPARHGAEGERVDGRGGMSGKHRDGCGHLVGRRTWGWGAI